MVVSALDALAGLAVENPRLRDRVTRLVREHSSDASPAVRKRAERLPDELESA